MVCSRPSQSLCVERSFVRRILRDRSSAALSQGGSLLYPVKHDKNFFVQRSGQSGLPNQPRSMLTTGRLNG